MSRGGLLLSRPLMRATTLVRLGCDSRTTGSRPTSDRRAATCSAAWRSPGPEWSPGLEVSILIRSRQMVTTSSWAVGPWFAGAWFAGAWFSGPWFAGPWFAVTGLWSHPDITTAGVLGGWRQLAGSGYAGRT